MVARNPISRKDLTNQQWQRLQSLLPKASPKGGRPANDHRTIINSILWILRTSDPWRDLHNRYGAWETVSGRFYARREDCGNRFSTSCSSNPMPLVSLTESSTLSMAV